MKKYLYVLVFFVSIFFYGQEKPKTTQPESETLFSGKIIVNASSGSEIVQEKLLQGTVTDKNNEPLLGVKILIDKTFKGTNTDFDGKYSIAAKPTDTLIFSSPGFKTQKIKAEKKELIINMEEDIQLVDVLPYTPNRPRKTAPIVLNIKDIHSVNDSIQFNEQYSFIIGKWREIEYHGNNGADDYVNKIENGQILTFEKDGSLLIQKDGTTTLGSYEIFPHNEHNLKLHISSSKKEFHYLISNQVNPNYIYLTPVTSDYQIICKEGCGYVYEKIK